jgi:hypothetical protein
VKVVGGIWLPDNEQHLVEHMQQVNVKIDDKLTYQYNKLEKAMRYVKEWTIAIDVGAVVQAALISYAMTRLAIF